MLLPAACQLLRRMRCSSSRTMHAQFQRAYAFVGFFSAYPCASRWRSDLRCVRVRKVYRRRIAARCALPDIDTVTTLAVAGSSTVQEALLGPLFAPLNECTPALARWVIWLNFRSAVALFVVTPLAIFGGALFRGPDTNAGDSLTRVLSGYWQASALLLCAVFQHAVNIPSATAAGLLVQVVIAASLNWWTDLLGEIESIDAPLENAFRVWRPMATVAALVGVLVQIPFQRCNFVLPNTAADCLCVAWAEPPVRLFEMLGGAPHEVLAGLGNAGCAIYLGYLAYYIAVVLPRIGRQGRKRRDFFTALSFLLWAGVVVEKEEKSD